MLILNLFSIAILALTNPVFASPILGDNTLEVRDQPPPPQPPVPPPVPPPPPPPGPTATPTTTANNSTVASQQLIILQSPVPRIHLVPRPLLDKFTGIPVPPHRPRQRRGLAGGYAGKLPDFVKDDRYQWNSHKYPAYSLGRVFLGANSFANGSPRACSGSLVGPRHVLIARHCFGDTLADSVTFESNYFDGWSGGISYATDIIAFHGLECHKTPTNEEEIFDCMLHTDWAILILADRMGDTHGYLGVKEFDTKTMMHKQAFVSKREQDKRMSTNVKSHMWDILLGSCGIK
jgi:hypothetical protein